MSDVSEVRAMYERSATELRAEIERLTNFGELARQAALRAEERAGVAEQALTDQAERIAAELERVRDSADHFDSCSLTQAADIVRSGASTTRETDENG